MTRTETSVGGPGPRTLAVEQMALRRVATLVAEGVPAAELYAAVTSEVAELLDVAAVDLVRFGPGRSIAILASLNDPSFPTGSHWPLDGDSVSARVFDTGRPARIDDFSTLTGTIAEGTRASNVSASAGVPIVVDGVVWGMLAVNATGGESLAPDTDERLRDFTELVATAIANQQARDELRELAAEQTALRRVATLVATGLPEDEIFDAVAGEVGRLFGADVTQLGRYDDDGVVAIGTWSASGEDLLAIGTRSSLGGDNAVTRVKETGAPARMDWYDEATGEAGEKARRLGWRSAIAAPIVEEGRVWGVMLLATTRDEAFSVGAEVRLAAFTELVATAVSNSQAHADLRNLAAEQAALRRVATLVALGADASGIFDAVCSETGHLVGASAVNLSHYTTDGVNLTVAGWSLRDTHVPVGTRFPITDDTIAGAIARTGGSARIDNWDDADSELAQIIRERGIRTSVGAPVAVDGRLWGALVAASDIEDGLPPDTELRLARFTELIATAVSNATTRSDLIASRARIVAAGDEARRKIERNLHDGTQQRLIALGLDVQRIRSLLDTDPAAAGAALERMEADVMSIFEDLRELARGLHPPLLARGGLRPSLRVLARRSPIPVELEFDLPERPAPSVETAAYYVVSEALTNAIKHSEATFVTVTVATDHAGGPFGMGLDGSGRIVNLHLTIVDDGVGGADAAEGSGLMGLIDRVDALGGHLQLESPPGGGTRISVELPLEPVL